MAGSVNKVILIGNIGRPSSKKKKKSDDEDSGS